MNREQLIRVAMQAINTEADAIDPTTGNVLVNYARAAVDAVLPQISDSEQLIGFPDRSLLIDRDGELYRIIGRELLYAYPPMPVGDEFWEMTGPLTVVWQP